MLLYRNNSLTILFCWILLLLYTVRILFASLDVSRTNVSIIWSKLAATGADSGSYTCLHTGYPDPVYVSINIIVIQPGNI